MLVSKHCTANLICTLGTPPPPCIGSGVARVQISGTELCTNNLIPTLATLKDDLTSHDVYQYYEPSLIGWFLALAAFVNHDEWLPLCNCITQDEGTLYWEKY